MIRIVTGDPGTGKTLYLAALGHIGYSSYRNVYANFTLYEMASGRIVTYQDIENIDTSPNILLLDEFHKNADARMTQSLANREAVGWAAQHRKLGGGEKGENDVYISIQSPRQLDPRIKDITKVWIEPSIAYWDNGTPRLLKLVSYTRGRRDTYTTSTSWLPLILPLHHGIIDVCECYDTTELVQGIENSGPLQIYSTIIDRYKEWEITKKDLVAKLWAVEKVPKRDCPILADLILSMQTD